jgi:hypothetical protein
LEFIFLLFSSLNQRMLALNAAQVSCRQLVFVHARTLIEVSLLFFLLEHYNQLGDPSSGILKEL